MPSRQARIASDGRRASLSGETEALGRCRKALGKPGTALAMALRQAGALPPRGPASFTRHSRT